MHLFNNCVGAA